MLPKLHGMFAFVIWDTVSRRAFAARDPYGIKPLPISQQLLVGCAADASEVKALLATGEVSRDPDPRGQAGFWMLGSVPEPNTWYRDIQSIPSGHSAWIENGRMAEPMCWFDIGRVWRDTPTEVLPDNEAQCRVRAALRESVSRHLVSDVPVGVFLSGGIDWGEHRRRMIAEVSPRNIEGVTIAYDEFSGSHKDEAPVAATIAYHYGIRHHVRRISCEEFLADMPAILDAMDQPSIDGINTWYASKAVAACGLKVVVSGVGGDELFQGYGHFKYLPSLVRSWRVLSRIPGVTGLGKLAGRIQANRTGNARWRHAAEWGRTIGSAWWLRKSVYAPEELFSSRGMILPKKRYLISKHLSGVRR